MSFSRAPIQRFNDVTGQHPPFKSSNSISASKDVGKSQLSPQNYRSRAPLTSSSPICSSSPAGENEASKRLDRSNSSLSVVCHTSLSRTRKDRRDRSNDLSTLKHKAECSLDRISKENSPEKKPVVTEFKETKTVDDTNKDPKQEKQNQTLLTQFQTKKRRFNTLKKELLRKQKCLLDLYSNMAALRERLTVPDRENLWNLDDIKIFDLNQLQEQQNAIKETEGTLREERKKKKNVHEEKEIQEEIISGDDSVTEYQAGSEDRSLSCQALSTERLLQDLSPQIVLNLERKLTDIPQTCLTLCKQMVLKRNTLFSLVDGLADEDGSGFTVEAELRRQLDEYQIEADNFDKLLVDVEAKQQSAVVELMTIIRTLVEETETLRSASKSHNDVPQDVVVVESCKQCSSYTELKTNFSKIQTENNELHERVEIVVDQLVAEKDKTKSRASQITKMKKQVEEMTQFSAKLEKQLHDKEKNIQQLHKLIEEQAKYKDMSNAAKTSAELISELDKQRESLEKKIAEISEEKSRLETEATVVIMDLESRLNIANKQTEKEIENRDKLQAELIKLQVNLHNAELNKKETVQRTDQATQSDPIPKEEEKEGPSINKELLQREAELLSDLHMTRTRLNASDKRVEELEKENISLRERSNRKSKHHLDLEQMQVMVLTHKDYQINQLTREVKQANKLIKLNQAQFAKYEERVSELYSRLSSAKTTEGCAKLLQQQVSDLKNQINEVQMSLIDVERRNDELEQTLVHKQLEIEIHDRATQKQQRVLKAREEQVASLKATLQELEQNTEKIKLEVLSKSEELQSLHSTLEFKQEQIQQLENTVKQMKEQRKHKACYRLVGNACNGCKNEYYLSEHQVFSCYNHREGTPHIVNHGDECCTEQTFSSVTDKDFVKETSNPIFGGDHSYNYVLETKEPYVTSGSTDGCIGEDDENHKMRIAHQQSESNYCNLKNKHLCMAPRKNNINAFTKNHEVSSPQVTNDQQSDEYENENVVVQEQRKSPHCRSKSATVTCQRDRNNIHRVCNPQQTKVARENLTSARNDEKSHQAIDANLKNIILHKDVRSQKYENEIKLSVDESVAKFKHAKVRKQFNNRYENHFHMGRMGKEQTYCIYPTIYEEPEVSDENCKEANKMEEETVNADSLYKECMNHFMNHIQNAQFANKPEMPVNLLNQLLLHKPTNNIKNDKETYLINSFPHHLEQDVNGTNMVHTEKCMNSRHKINSEMNMNFSENKIHADTIHTPERNLNTCDGLNAPETVHVEVVNSSPNPNLRQFSLLRIPERDEWSTTDHLNNRFENVTDVDHKRFRNEYNIQVQNDKQCQVVVPPMRNLENAEHISSLPTGKSKLKCNVTLKPWSKYTIPSPHRIKNYTGTQYHLNRSSNIVSNYNCESQNTQPNSWDNTYQQNFNTHSVVQRPRSLICRTNSVLNKRNLEHLQEEEQFMRDNAWSFDAVHSRCPQVCHVNVSNTLNSSDIGNHKTQWANREDKENEMLLGAKRFFMGRRNSRDSSREIKKLLKTRSISSIESLQKSQRYSPKSHTKRYVNPSITSHQNIYQRTSSLSGNSSLITTYEDIINAHTLKKTKAVPSGTKTKRMNKKQPFYRLKKRLVRPTSNYMSHQRTCYDLVHDSINLKNIPYVKKSKTNGFNVQNAQCCCNVHKVRNNAMKYRRMFDKNKGDEITDDYSMPLEMEDYEHDYYVPYNLSPSSSVEDLKYVKKCKLNRQMLSKSNVIPLKFDNNNNDYYYKKKQHSCHKIKRRREFSYNDYVTSSDIEEFLNDHYTPLSCVPHEGLSEFTSLMRPRRKVVDSLSRQQLVIQEMEELSIIDSSDMEQDVNYSFIVYEPSMMCNNIEFCDTESLSSDESYIS